MLEKQALLTGIANPDRGTHRAGIVENRQQARHENRDTGPVHLEKALRDESLYAGASRIAGFDQAGYAGG